MSNVMMLKKRKQMFKVVEFDKIDKRKRHKIIGDIIRYINESDRFIFGYHHKYNKPQQWSWTSHKMTMADSIILCEMMKYFAIHTAITKEEENPDD
jgi:hypothetical protein